MEAGHPTSSRVGWAALFVAALALAAAASSAAAQPAPSVHSIPAFPSAEGFGMWTVGGRGGDVHLVTTLADYAEGEAPIPGSLRAAVEAEGPRTVIFHVAGHIDLARTLEVHEPYLTIAGQSAPGEGVTLRRYGMEVYAPEVILRHLRIRPGADAGEEQDALTLRNGPAIVDHCSVGWATDETLSVIAAATDVTVQRCLIAESLNESVHSKGAHGYGTLITASGDVTIHHSVYAFHESRNPRPKDVLLDFRHNLIVGYGGQPGYTYDDFLRMNHVGNVFSPRAYSRAPECVFNVGGTNARVYAADNLRLVDDGRQRDADEWLCASRGVEQAEIGNTVRVPIPFAAPSVTPTPAEALQADLLADVGATRPVRDAVDARVLGQIERGDGQIIDSPDDVGGWLHIAPAEPPADADRDGMPDAWERRHELDPIDPDDHRGDLDGDGYTNLEEFLNGTDPTEPVRWVPPPTLSPAGGAAFTDSVVITVDAGGLPVHVTLDGTEPTEDSPRFTGPITLRDDAHLRARVIVRDIETTAAVAFYDRLDWRPASGTDGPLVPGLAAATYVSDDWDEGPAPEELMPADEGVAPDVDSVLRRRQPGTAVLLDGWLDVPADGVYTFWFYDHPRSRLLIDGEAVSPGMPSGRRPARLALRRGLHRIGVRSLHEEPQRRAGLTWEGPGISRGPISPERLRHNSPAP